MTALLDACKEGLAASLRRLSPHAVLDSRNYVHDTLSNLIEGVHLEDIEADLLQGGGNELAGKFLAAHSSTALAVNTFAPFKRGIAALRIADSFGFSRLHFERKCPHGLRRGEPPNLDVVAEGNEHVLAIECKCTEPLTPTVAKFKPAYDIEIRDDRRKSIWFKEMQRLVGEPRSFRCLDAAQLVKHAFGLARTFPDKPVTLLYLFWEPANASSYPFFAQHRDEVDRFAALIEGGSPKFKSMSYPELWDLWSRQQSGPAWLAPHIDRLRTRYLVAV